MPYSQSAMKHQINRNTTKKWAESLRIAKSAGVKPVKWIRYTDWEFRSLYKWTEVTPFRSFVASSATNYREVISPNIEVRAPIDGSKNFDVTDSKVVLFCYVAIRHVEIFCIKIPSTLVNFFGKVSAVTASYNLGSLPRLENGSFLTFMRQVIKETHYSLVNCAPTSL